MKVSLTIRAEGIVTVDVPDDKLPELAAFMDDHESMHARIDPAELPGFCGIDMGEVMNQMAWEVEDIWWKGQG
jgi:hypothetical protein